MRFAAPRSTSPSPVRRHSRSTFGVHSVDSDDEGDRSDAESIASSSTDSFCYASDSEVPPPSPRRKSLLPISEQHRLQDTVASIRLHVRHKDPYEEWERDIRRDAFTTAKKEHAQGRSQRHQAQKQARLEETQRRSALHEQQLKEVQNHLANLTLQKQKHEEQLRVQWKSRDKNLWDRIDAVIKYEEEKARAKLEAERKKREEEERVKREAEEKKRQEEERKRKEELEKRLQKEKSEEEQRRQAEAQRLQAERDQAEAQGRKAAGLTSAFEDWKRARDTLRALKNGPMKAVKADSAMKAMWGAGRRAITPKIGQLTNDPSTISQISQQLLQILRPHNPHPPAVYIALLSSLAKAILLQAETEVTAEKRSALPLAAVATQLLGALDGFADIFWAKLCQRAGGWPVPIVVPGTDSDGTAFTPETRRKALGYRADEARADYMARVEGVMRVYFHILVAPVSTPLDPVVRLPRYWTFFGRMLREPQLLGSPIAPQMLYTGLEVGGAMACEVWGQQWVRLLALLYEGVTTGFHGRTEQLVGGKSPEGIAARVRVQLEIERIISAF